MQHRRNTGHTHDFSRTVAPQLPAARKTTNQCGPGSGSKFCNRYGEYTQGIQREGNAWKATGNDTWKPNDNLPWRLPAAIKEWLINKEHRKPSPTKCNSEGTVAPQVQWVNTTEREKRYQERKQNGGFFEVMSAQDLPAGIPQEEAEFGSGSLTFPTLRRPRQSRRPLLVDGGDAGFEAWLEKYPEMIGPLADTPERLQTAKRLLNTWRDMFCEDVRQMPATDLVEHRIPTYKEVRPKMCRPTLYTPEELAWQKEHFKSLIEVGIITRCESPWSARTKFPKKKESGKLCMVHVFCPINDATIKSNYTMKRIEPVLQQVSQEHVKVKFQVDASNGYWAIKLHPAHAYKSAFSSAFGQFAYLRMGQGLTGGPATYSKLKDIVTGEIPEPDPEPALSNVAPEIMFAHFVDDDLGGAPTFEALINFLHNHYFPRLAWSGLTLNPEKSKFFVEEVRVLG